jgi:hypothetical protein
MDDKQSLSDSLMHQVRVVGTDMGSPSNCCTDLRTDLRIDELSTIRKLLERCTIDATRHEVMHVLEATCTHPEECIDCTYKNSLGECNRNERIADILLNRLGRVK